MSIDYHYAVGSDAKLEEDIATGAVVIGRLSVFKYFQMNLCFVRSALFPTDISVNTAQLRGEAMHGDVVAVELLPRDRWYQSTDVLDGDSGISGTSGEMPSQLPDGRPITQMIATETRETTGMRGAVEVEVARSFGVSAVVRWSADERPVGRVVRVLQRHLPSLHVARIFQNSIQPGEPLRANFYYRFCCFDPRYPQLAVQGRDIPPAYAADIASTLFLLELQSNGTGSLTMAPRLENTVLAKVKSFLGSANSISINSAAICSTNDIRDEPFSTEAEACVPFSVVIPATEEEVAKMGRRDLRRSEFVCTIDPATARDLDDALSIRRRADGGYHVGIHIADVSYFVRPNTALDEEAQMRSTSTYLVERVIAMLPRRLSEDFCSLNPSEDKYAFSILCEFDRNGHMILEANSAEKPEWFGQSIIRSRCRMAYEQAQQILNDDETVVIDVAKEAAATGLSEESLQREVRRSVKLLFELASKLRQQSLEKGRLTMGNTRLGFRFDTEAPDSPPIAFRVGEQIKANWLVEEFMLLANQRVAEKVLQYLPNGALLRSHKPPEYRKMNRLRSTMHRHGLPMTGSSGRDLQTMLNEVKEKHPEKYYTVCELLKYSLMAAAYVANDPTAKEVRSHFAIAAPWYTHFTSPIRRYTDLVVHRQLLVALELEKRMEEMEMAPPSLPDPSLSPKPGTDIFDARRAVDVSTLATKDLFLAQSEVENIASHANTCKENARKAGDSSVEFFFCRYLSALLKKNATSPTPSKKVLTTAVVVQLTPGSMLLFSAEIALQVETGMKDTAQRFQYIGSQLPDADAPEQSEEAPPPARHADAAKVEVKAKAHARKKGGKSNLPPRASGNSSSIAEARNMARKGGAVQKPESGVVYVSWGLNPSTGEEEIEGLDLFSELVVALEIVSPKGRLMLKMIVLPPWERAAYYASGYRIPSSLVD